MTEERTPLFQIPLDEKFTIPPEMMKVAPENLYFEYCEKEQVIKIFTVAAQTATPDAPSDSGARPETDTESPTQPAAPLHPSES